MLATQSVRPGRTSAPEGPARDGQCRAVRVHEAGGDRRLSVALGVVDLAGDLRQGRDCVPIDAPR